MFSFRVQAIPEEIVSAVRAARRSPQYEHPVHSELAMGYGPCRFCLRQFRKGEEQRLLFTYNPFAGLSTYPSPGPVFIHEADCSPFAEAGFPEELRALPLMLEGYDEQRLVVARERAEGKTVEANIQRLLAVAGVRYVHLRNAEAGCFIAHIEPLASAEGA
jgi:hypothetical protein